MRASRIADLAVWPLQLVAALCALLPLRWVQRLGRWIGWLWSHLVPVRARVVTQNLALAFPELAPRVRRRIAHGCFAHVATTVLELFWLARQSREAVAAVVRVEGIEHYTAASEDGRGVIAVTAHLGNFDLLACSQALAGVPLHVVTKRLAASRLNEIWMERRRAAGVRLLAQSGSLEEILGALRRGDVVGLVVDQRTPAEDGGRLMDFFGAPAWTTLAPAVLGRRTGAAILPVMTVRLRDGTHLVRVGSEIRPGATSLATTADLNRRLEKWIRWNPEQWLWLHRRWAP